MDPDANLAEQLTLAKQLITRCDVFVGGSMEADEIVTDAARLAELVEALNGWIAGGGFLPARWMEGKG